MSAAILLEFYFIFYNLGLSQTNFEFKTRLASPERLNLTHKISNEIDTAEDKKQLNEPLPNDL